jgi:hypothetical protein
MTDHDANIPEKANHYEVSAAWMKACGKGTEAKVFPIHRVRGRLPGGAIVLDVLDGERLWTVIHPWRGRPV